MSDEQVNEMKVGDGEIKAVVGEKFCPLCMKNRKSGEFKECVIGALPGMVIKVEACISCNVVFHNAQRICQEVIQKYQQQQREQQALRAAIDEKIGKKVFPGASLPKDFLRKLKGGKS